MKWKCWCRKLSFVVPPRLPWQYRFLWHRKKQGKKKRKKFTLFWVKRVNEFSFSAVFTTLLPHSKAIPLLHLTFAFPLFFASSTLLSKIKRSRFCLVAKGFKVMVAMVHQISFEQTKNWQSPSTPSPLYPRIWPFLTKQNSTRDGNFFQDFPFFTIYFSALFFLYFSLPRRGQEKIRWKIESMRKQEEDNSNLLSDPRAWYLLTIFISEILMLLFFEEEVGTKNGWKWWVWNDYQEQIFLIEWFTERLVEMQVKNEAFFCTWPPGRCSFKFLVLWALAKLRSPFI